MKSAETKRSRVIAMKPAAINPDRRKVVEEARARYLQLSQERIKRDFHLQDVLSAEQLDPAAISDAYGQTVKTEIEMLKLLAGFYRDTGRKEGGV